MADQPQTETASATSGSFQFDMRTLFALPLFVAVYFTLAHWLGVRLAVAVTIPAGLLLACCYVPTRGYAKPLLAVYLLLAVMTLLFSAFPGARATDRRAQCRNNLKQLALGLHNYHDVYGTFPPAYVADENGKPMHSWRVLILPFIEQEPLYAQYDFSEPWDGPNNRSLSSVVLQVFCCPSDPAGYTTNTSYVLITGDETGWVADRPSCFNEFADGSSETIVLVEITNSNIHWMEPRDLTLSQAMRGINAPAGVCISSHHPGGANAACADGSVHFLPDTLPASEIHALITIDGQERIHPDW